MFDDSYEFAVEALPQRQVPRARLLLGLGLVGEKHVVVLDADSGEFVRVPGMPRGDDWSLLALAPDGSQLLLLCQRGPRRWDGLCLHTLATGRQQWFDALADGQDYLAALSPDGHSIATLSTDDDPLHPDDLYGLAIVSVIDVATGHRRRLWAGPGSWSAESAVSWSPDGQLVAVTYLQPPNEELDREEECGTVVIDPNGNMIGYYDLADIPSAPNGAWTSDRDLMMYLPDEEGNEMRLQIINVREGTRRDLGSPDIVPRAIIGNRLIADRSDGPRGYSRLISMDLDGTHRQPFITIRPHSVILPFDIARSV